MKSPYFNEDHETFRDTVRQFVQKDIIPNTEKWEEERKIPKEIWKKMGELGFLGINFPEKYGGSDADFFYSVVFLEELAKCGMGGFSAAVSVHQYMAVNHLFEAGSEELKEKYLIPAIKGEKIASLAISEPNTGSDVSSIETKADKNGDYYLVNGSKTFITNGHYCDFITLAVKTKPEQGINSISLLVVDKNSEGVTSRKLNKMGWHSSDTAELIFEDVKVPVTNLIGKENMGFYYIMESFQLERLVSAIIAVAGAEHCIDTTLRYINERKAFNRSISKFQTIRHKIAELVSELESAKQMTYYTSWLYSQGEVPVQHCSMAKLVTTELSKKVVDSCLQFFGGYGYMDEYPVSRMYRDARVGTIAGGTSEIMKEIISKIIIDNVNYKSAYNETNKDEYFPVKVLFNKLPENYKPVEENWNSLFHFDISGEKGGKFTVNINGNNLSVEEGLNGEPICLIETDYKTYTDIQLGKKDPHNTFMAGEVKVSNIPEMIKFIKSVIRKK